MRDYSVKLNNGKVLKMSHIGLNHTANGETFDGVMSSYHKYFDNYDEVILEKTSESIRCAIIGDISEAYKILRDNINSQEPRNFEEYTRCIERAIITYFGHKSNDKKYLSYFPSNKEIKKENKKMGRVSNLAHKNMAKSIERTMVAHNLLLESGIESIFKISSTMINGKECTHAFNLISYSGKYYLFDATIPTSKDYEINPIVCEIPEEAYLNLISPISDIGYSVEVNHLNPLDNQEYSVIYDAGRDNVYKEHKTRVKKIGER